MIKINVADNEVYGVVGNEFINDETISNEILSVYAVMRTMLFDIKKSCSVLNMQTLYELLGADSKQAKTTKPIKEAIEWLIENKYIELYDMKYNKKEFDSKSQSLFRISFLNEDENNWFILDGGYATVPEINMKNVLDYIARNKGMKKYAFIRTYLCIARACSNDDNCYRVSIDKISEVASISDITCSEWIMVLKDLGCIDFNNDYGHVKKDGSFKMDSTIFGHYNSESRYGGSLTSERFQAYVDYKVKELKVVKVDKAKIANKKSDAMKKVWEGRKKANQEPIVEEVVNECWGESDPTIQNVKVVNNPGCKKAIQEFSRDIVADMKEKKAKEEATIKAQEKKFEAKHGKYADAVRVANQVDTMTSIAKSTNSRSVDIYNDEPEPADIEDGVYVICSHEMRCREAEEEQEYYSNPVFIDEDGEVVVDDEDYTVDDEGVLCFDNVEF